MFPSQLKIALIGIAMATAFTSGWLVNGWRLTANHVATLEELTERMQQHLTDQADAFKEGAETLRLRETNLAEALQAERSTTEKLQDEIDNAEVVTVEVAVPVAGECPACAAIDSVRYRTLYNRAATGTVPDPGAGISALSGPPDTP